ncbi:hypothetical protein D1164_21110 [Mariniphaga sediminis]|jgi:hypothetical protein|uniref:Uncharacterized protein n=2 Tax=Mariniphaga sediminis TaxID=1628158 RepID=A0A399CTH3_9BACT|nr:hypothetical protein D1164_21110 [Mariniphaga sediminis]
MEIQNAAIMKLKYSYLAYAILLSLMACSSGKREGVFGSLLYKRPPEFPGIIYTEGNNLRQLIYSITAYFTLVYISKIIIIKYIYLYKK